MHTASDLPPMDKYSNTWGIGDVIKMNKLAARSGAACCQRCRSCPLMTIISLRTERSDPVAPHGAGVSLSLCVCTHQVVLGKSVSIH